MRQHPRPLTHDWIWCAIDTLAMRRGLSASGLACFAGLDPTAFNRSKRQTAEGRLRWPSTESIAKILAATKTSLDEFAAIELCEPASITLDDPEDEIAGVPVVGEVRGAVVEGWSPLGGLASIYPSGAPQRAAAGSGRFALAVADGSLEPVYSSGNVLVVSEAAESRPGDRILVKPAGSLAMPRLLVKASPADIEVRPFGSQDGASRIARCNIDWIARIVLVRQ